MTKMSCAACLILVLKFIRFMFFFLFTRIYDTVELFVYVWDAVQGLRILDLVSPTASMWAGSAGFPSANVCGVVLITIES